jgi:cyclopropane fatty-acyl-phospholipid synthase-like methyltransferase
MMAAAHGAGALGVDVAPAAIAKARGKAAERGSAARFEVADVLDLGHLGLTFDTVVDSGVFHVFDDGDRARYAASLASVMGPGATCYLLCFSDRQPGTMGPRRITQDEITAAFRGGWDIRGITAETFAVNFMGESQAQAWLATIERSAAEPGG